MKLNNSQIELLKYIAFFLMIGDHYSNLFLTDENILKYLGRIVFPLFSFVLVYNYIFNTTNKKKYIIRIFLFALISEPFYQFAFNEYFSHYSMNILFSLGIGLFLLYIYEEYKEWKIMYLIIFPFLIIFNFYISYGIQSIFLILSLYFFLKKNNIFNFIILCLSIFLLNIFLSILISLIGLFSILVIYIVSKININIYRNKYIFYIFYPLHLLLLKLIFLFY